MPRARAEQKFPDFQERLLTLAEKPNASDPFLELLAADTMHVAATSQPERLASTGPIVGFLTSAGLAVAVLLWLILAGPGYLGYGTSLLWAGAPKSGKHAFYDIAVTPGDRTVRRKSDQLVTAQLLGFDSPKVRLFAQYRGASKWEQVDMQPSPGASTYEFLFSGLADNVEYYVEAGAVQSKHYNLRVVDLPAIKKIRVTYHYPVLDRNEGRGGRSGRRFARRGRHRSRGRDPNRSSLEQGRSDVGRRSPDRTRKPGKGIGSPPASRSTRTACITSPPSITARTSA